MCSRSWAPLPALWRRPGRSPRTRRPAVAFLVSFAALGVIAARRPRSAVAALVPLGLVLYTVASRFRPGLAGAALCAAPAAAVATALPDFKHSGGATFFT